MSLRIRTMTASDLEFAAACTANEGWVSETLDEFQGFFLHDPTGCFVAETEGERAGISIATSYGAAGFIGEIIVARGGRGGVIGWALLGRAIEYLEERGAKALYLDGVRRAVPAYEQAGFRRVCPSLRFSGRLEGTRHGEVRQMTASDFQEVCALDRAAFGADRSFFLMRRLALYPDVCKVQQQDGEMIAFAFGRRAEQLVSIGPWYVKEKAEHAEYLLEDFATAAGESRIGIGVLESNTKAVELIRSLGITERKTSPWRMVRGPNGKLLGEDPALYAIGTAAKG